MIMRVGLLMAASTLVRPNEQTCVPGIFDLDRLAIQDALSYGDLSCWPNLSRMWLLGPKQPRGTEIDRHCSFTLHLVDEHESL